MKTELSVDEALVREGFASLYRGVEVVGGKLYLTSCRLVFEPHPINFQRSIENIELREVASIRPFRLLWIVPYGINVELADGTVHSLAVYYPGRWLRTIELARRGPSH